MIIIVMPQRLATDGRASEQQSSHWRHVKLRWRPPRRRALFAGPGPSPGPPRQRLRAVSPRLIPGPGHPGTALQARDCPALFITARYCPSLPGNMSVLLSESFTVTVRPRSSSRSRQCQCRRRRGRRADQTRRRAGNKESHYHPFQKGRHTPSLIRVSCHGISLSAICIVSPPASSESEALAWSPRRRTPAPRARTAPPAPTSAPPSSLRVTQPYGRLRTPQAAGGGRLGTMTWPADSDLIEQ